MRREPGLIGRKALLLKLLMQPHGVVEVVELISHSLGAPPPLVLHLLRLCVQGRLVVHLVCPPRAVHFGLVPNWRVRVHPPR